MIYHVGYVYKTVNTQNGKIYIGQHAREEFDPLYYGSGKLILAALRKYGRQAFKVEVLYWAETSERLDEAEIAFIAAFDSTNLDVGYNLSLGGGIEYRGRKLSKPGLERVKELRKGRVGWNKGKKMPEAQRLAMAERMKGKKFPELALQRAIKANTGRKLTEEQKKKMSLAMKGKKGTRNGMKTPEETKRKQSESNKGKHSVPMPESAKEKLRQYWKGKPWPEARRLAEKKRQEVKHGTS